MNHKMVLGVSSVTGVDLFSFSFFSHLPCTSLWGVYSPRFIHHFNIPLAHSFTCLFFVSFFPSSHVYPALCLLPLVTVCTVFVFRLFTIKHFGRLTPSFHCPWYLKITGLAYVRVLGDSEEGMSENLCLLSTYSQRFFEEERL